MGFSYVNLVFLYCLYGSNVFIDWMIQFFALVAGYVFVAYSSNDADIGDASLFLWCAMNLGICIAVEAYLSLFWQQCLIFVNCFLVGFVIRYMAL